MKSQIIPHSPSGEAGSILSIEFIAQISPPVDQDTLERLVQKIKANHYWRVIRQTADELAICHGEHIDEQRESISIYLAPHEILIAFHVAQGQERAELVDVLQGMLREVGVASRFEEE